LNHVAIVSMEPSKIDQASVGGEPSVLGGHLFGIALVRMIMRLLLFSDVHCDASAARSLVDRSSDADVIVCAGDLAVMRGGLQEIVDILAVSTKPAVLVAGNGESASELVEACSGWSGAHVLHGSGCEIDGVPFWGLGGGIPVTPFGSWSFDLSEGDAAPLLSGCSEGGVLVTHSPPLGHVDLRGGIHFGSQAILEVVERVQPGLMACGHIHSCWMEESRIGVTRVINAGPDGIWAEL
jgi:Icc-related predicted phosphoesterase